MESAFFIDPMITLSRLLALATRSSRFRFRQSHVGPTAVLTAFKA